MDECEIYWPQTNTTQSVDVLPAPRFDHKIVVIERDGEEFAYVLSGREEWLSTTNDNTIYMLRSSGVESWETVGTFGGSSPDASNYAVGIVDDMVYFIGGVDSSGTEFVAAEVLNLSTGVALSGVFAAPSLWTAPASSVQIGKEVLNAVSDVGGRSYVQYKIEPIDDASQYNGASLLNPPTITGSGLQQCGACSWDGEYILGMAGELHSFNKARNSFIGAVSGVTVRYGTDIHAFDGRVVQLGGSSDATFSDASDLIGSYVLPGKWIRERADENLLKNFKTGQAGKSVGFQSGQPYGAVCYSDEVKPSYVLMSDEII